VVTGGSDGIGLAMCNQLAQQGFNICIVSRNEAKIKEKLAEINAKHPDVQTKCVAADLGKLTTIAQYKALVAEHLNDIDIGYLALNAGIGISKIFDKADDSVVEDVMVLNGLHVVYLAKALLPQMLKRETRSAIVITSSVASYLPLVGGSVYSATKALERLFGVSLHYETRHKIDVLVYTPGYVNTKLLDDGKGKRTESALRCEPEDGVRAMHKDLVRGRPTSCGSIKHSLTMMLVNSSIVQYFLLNASPKKQADEKKRESEESSIKEPLIN